jgi:hypothetical protein
VLFIVIEKLIMQQQIIEKITTGDLPKVLSEKYPSKIEPSADPISNDVWIFAIY